MDGTRVCDGCRKDIGIHEEIMCSECIKKMHIYIKELEKEIINQKEEQ